MKAASQPGTKRQHNSNTRSTFLEGLRIFGTYRYLQTVGTTKISPEAYEHYQSSKQVSNVCLKRKPVWPRSWHSCTHQHNPYQEMLGKLLALFLFWDNFVRNSWMADYNSSISQTLTVSGLTDLLSWSHVSSSAMSTIAMNLDGLARARPFDWT